MEKYKIAESKLIIRTSRRHYELNNGEAYAVKRQLLKGEKGFHIICVVIFNYFDRGVRIPSSPQSLRKSKRQVRQEPN